MDETHEMMEGEGEGSEHDMLEMVGESEQSRTRDAVSDEDLSTCCKVLEHLAGCMDEYRYPRYKPLRKLLVPFLEEEGKRRYGGMGKEMHSARKQAIKVAHIQQERARANDRKFIENTRLRAARRARLDALKASNPNCAQFLIPDGYAEDEGSVKLIGAAEMMEEGKEVPSSSEEKTGEVEKEGEEKRLLHHARSCYICKVRFHELHFFYDQLCPHCAELNYRKRLQTADLTGKVAVLTGARVKIGYRVALKLLRAGATLIATTRFP